MIKLFDLFKKLTFKIPKKKKYLFYDDNSLQIQKYLKLKNFTILHTRNEEINVFIFFAIFLEPKKVAHIFKYNLSLVYICKYIEYVNPTYVINFIDNDVKFYKLKQHFKDIIFISIQNGLRTQINDIFSNESFLKSNDLKCDYYLVFNKNIAKKLSTIIKSKFIVFGSLKNNFFSKTSIQKKSEILYLSQFRNIKHIKYKNRFISLKNWIIDHEKKLLNNVLLFCDKNNKKLNILSVYDKRHPLFLSEANYFKKIILNKNWKLIPSKKKSKKSNNYKLVDSFEVILTSWSTLGYESLGRGNKVAFFPPKNFYGTKGRSFGWPYELPKKGKFYSDISDFVEVNRVLKYLFYVNKQSWQNDSSFYKKNLIKKFNGLGEIRKILTKY